VTPPQLVEIGAAHDLGDVAFQLGLAQVAKLDGHQIAMHAQHRRQTDCEMNVGAALVAAELQKGVYTGHGAGSLPCKEGGRYQADPQAAVPGASTSRYVRVPALARFDATLSRLEKASALAL